MQTIFWVSIICDSLLLFAISSTVSLSIYLIYLFIHNNRDPIECITESKYKAQVETFCWTHGTYINERLLHERNEIGKHMVNYGIGGDQEGDKYIYQYYYQWVVPILLLEALIFYFPKLLWRSWENGRMQTICSKISKVIQ